MTTTSLGRPRLLALLALGLLAAGCDQQGPLSLPDSEGVVWAETRLGDTCDWQAIADCGPGFQCDRITDEGEYLDDGICMLAQGASCPNPSAMGLVTEFCGRALSCQAATRERERFICLPNTCIDNTECRTGEGCRNGMCAAAGPGCHAL